MPYYENVFIARQDVSSAQVNTLADGFAEIITQNGGQVTKREYWGLRNLAYRIRKNRKGHYVLFNLDAPWPAVQEMERNMRLSEDVIRFLTVKVDELEEGPSPVMQGRSSRDDRRGRGPRRDDRRERRREGEPRAEEAKPAAEKPAEEKPAEEKPVGEKPVEAKAAPEAEAGEGAAAAGDADKSEGEES